MRSDLPGPEERVFSGIHASQREVEQPILGILIPILPVIPKSTVGIIGSIRFDPPQVKATIIDAGTVFPGNSNTEAGLAGKKVIQTLSKESEGRVVAYLTIVAFFHAEQANPGQMPPI